MNTCRHVAGRFGVLLMASLMATSLMASLANGPALAQTQNRTPVDAKLPPEGQARLADFKDSLNGALAEGNERAQVETLIQIGELLFRTSNYRQALESYDQALTVARSAKDAVAEAGALSGSGSCYLLLGETLRALADYRQALHLATSARDGRGQATALHGIGWAYSGLGQNKEALVSLTRALFLARRVEGQGIEATVLLRTGTVYSVRKEEGEALTYYDGALSIYREVRDRGGEAETLNDIGIVHDDLGEKQSALDYYNQALTIRREAGDRDGLAWTMNNIGNVYKTLRDKRQALDQYGQALAIFLEVGDRGAEAATMNDIGAVYRELGEPRQALDSYKQALPIYRQVGNLGGQAAALTNIGNVYYDLGEKQMSLAYYKQSLPIRRRVGNPAGEATTLNNVGAVYVELGKNTTALSYLIRALRTRRNIGDQAGQAATLINLGNVAYALGQKHNALADYMRALQLDRAIGDLGGEAKTLNNIGFVYGALGEPQEALDSLDKDLPLATAVRDPIEEARVLCNLMIIQGPRQPALSIFYGKQAINLLQRVRGNIQGLDNELQKSFLASKQDYYHRLADLLVSQGRLPEAQQVMDVMKQQEYSDYVRGETAEASSPLTLTPSETQAEAEYQRSTEQLVALGDQWAQLRTRARTPDEEKLYERLSSQLDAASKRLNDYYARLYVLLGRDNEANKQVADVKGNVSLLKQAIAGTDHTVALYTLVGTDRTSLIVITPTATVAREYTIPQAELNRKVAEFEHVLRSPARDPRPMAQELYNVLIGPVRADLDQAAAETLVWSLDGVLRYVPIAALYDGKHYLVEKYKSVTITPASIMHLADRPNVRDLSALAMGISHKYDAELPALPGVRSELSNVVTDVQVRGANGVLPGTILLDGQFTEKAMEQELGSRHAVVHIASHFVFRPGDDSNSYLLLAGKDVGGAGFHLTVADFRDNQNLALDDTDLLTLSACETGMSGSASDGREVDGLGTTAQLKGAKAVISSLWEVDDTSTGELMGDFYKRWVEGRGKLAKVEALRDAQLDLLRGKITPQSGGSDRGFSMPADDRAAALNYAHPYYWAPFVLMGNWR